eukprot:s3768_g14.t1
MGTVWGPEVILRRLFVARVPKALVLCLLLIIFAQNIDVSREWRFLELFAGQANVSRACRDAFFRGASMDLDYGGRAMDLTTGVGMAFLVPHSFRGCHEGSQRSSAKLQCPWPPKTLTGVGNAGRPE